MDFRAATEGDLNDILGLYRLAMGGVPAMRSEAYWKWKHLDNPFGVSPVMLAFDGSALAGLRVFLRWKFIREDKVIHAYRAVDTVTHPEYRGRGIFTALTMKMLEQVTEAVPAIVFNTPNRHSGPGYLKMGWKPLGRTRLLLGIKPFNRLQTRSDRAQNSLSDFSGADDIISRWLKENRRFIATNYSERFLNWRYRDVPVANYHSLLRRSGDSAVLLIYRNKETKGLRELRISEVFPTGPQGSRMLKEMVAELNERERPDVVTLLDQSDGLYGKLLAPWYRRMDWFGLQLTIREVNDGDLMDSVTRNDLWYFSSGTLELF